MNLLTFIYALGALALGFVAGMILELILDARTIRELQDDNRRLRLLNDQIANEKGACQVIEINDTRPNAPGIPNYFRPF